MKEIIIEIVAMFMLWVACGLNRKNDSEIAMFSKYWWIQCALMVLAIYLIKVYGVSKIK